MTHENQTQKILTSLEFGIQKATASYNRAYNALYSMVMDKKEYRSRFNAAILNNAAAVLLREIKTRVERSSSDQMAENLVRFHAYQLANLGTVNREDVTSLAQRRVASVLNHIIEIHLDDF